MTKSWFEWSRNDSKEPNWLGGWNWADRLGPEWFEKYGSWHTNTLFKLQKKTWKMFQQGTMVENGWGVYAEEVVSLCSEIQKLALKVYSDNTTKNLES